MHQFVPRPRHELLAAGVSRTHIDMDLRAGRSIALYRGVYIATQQACGLLQRIIGALHTQNLTAVATYTTAAVLHALRWLPPAWSDPSATVHVAVDASATTRHQAGMRLHRRRIASEDVVLAGGVPCMSVARTLVELARSPQVPALLVVQIVDGALRDGRVTKGEIERCLARFPGERGIARARELVRRSRNGVDSPRETQMRLMLEDGGVYDLDINIEISDEDGLVLARGDLGKKRLLIWGEYDGFDEHTRRRQFRGDRVGDRWLNSRGWHVMRFVDEDFGRPGRTCREWRQAIADAPARIAALPASKSPEVAEARRFLGFDRA